MLKKSPTDLDLIIDMHIHPAYYEKYNPSTLAWIADQQGVAPEDFIDSNRDPERFVQYLKECGVDYGVVMAELTPITTGICTNEYVAEFCRGREMLIPFASINPYTVTRPEVELEYWVKEHGFRGLKLYPTYQYFYPNDSFLYRLYAKAEELQIPIMFHTGSSIFKGARIKYGDPVYMDDVAVDFPNLNILMVHSGRGLWYEQAFFLSKMHPNLYMEIAGLPPQRLLTYFPEFERNADKIIFGSDWPSIASIKSNIDTIHNLPLKEETKRKILGGNAARILGLSG